MPAAREALHLEDVRHFYSLLNSREAIRKRRAAGLHGQAYGGPYEASADYG